MPRPQPPPSPTSVVEALVRRLGSSEEQDDPVGELLRAFKQKARWITRMKGPFVNIAAVLWAGMSSEPPNNAEYAEMFDDIMGLHPKFRETVEAIATVDDLEGYENLCQMLTQFMGNARSSDTNRLVTHIITYLPRDLALSAGFPPILNDKSKRGWNHNTTAAALCPLKLRTTFLHDPIAFRNSVQSGTQKIKSGDFPSFLYPDSAVYYRNDRAKGLFHGHVFIRALRSIYTGPSSAFTGHRTAARPSNSELHGMKEVTPHMIAYIAVQAHYALSDLGNWADTNRCSFNYNKFFKNIVKLFNNRDSTWARETLEYVTSELPALKRRSRYNQDDGSNSEEDRDSEDDFEAILAQQHSDNPGEPSENNNDPPMEESQSNARAEERAVSSPTRARAEATSGPPRADITNEEGGTSGQQTQPGASETPLANNRRSRSVDEDQDEQGEQNAGRPTISIPPCKTKPKSKKRRRY